MNCPECTAALANVHGYDTCPECGYVRTRERRRPTPPA